MVPPFPPPFLPFSFNFPSSRFHARTNTHIHTHTQVFEHCQVTHTHTNTPHVPIHASNTHQTRIKHAPNTHQTRIKHTQTHKHTNTGVTFPPPVPTAPLVLVVNVVQDPAAAFAIFDELTSSWLPENWNEDSNFLCFELFAHIVPHITVLYK